MGCVVVGVFLDDRSGPFRSEVGEAVRNRREVGRNLHLHFVHVTRDDGHGEKALVSTAGFTVPRTT